MPKVVVPVRLDEAMIARIDGAGVGRSVFIRQAIRVALGDKSEGERLVKKARSVKKPETGNPGTQPKPAAKPKTQPGVSRRQQEQWDADDAVVRDRLLERPMSQRELVREMGWPEIRVSRSLSRIGAVFVDGVAVVPE